MFEKTKMNEKEAGDGPFLTLPSHLIYFRFTLPSILINAEAEPGHALPALEVAVAAAGRLHRPDGQVLSVQRKTFCHFEKPNLIMKI